MVARLHRWCLLLVTACGPIPDAYSAGDSTEGRRLAIKYCARCHVVGDHNRLGGIGSTPSFQILTFIPDYVDRVRTFFTRRPHPVFARVPDYPRWSSGPSNVPEFTITPDEIEHIVEFVKTLETPR